MNVAAESSEWTGSGPSSTQGGSDATRDLSPGSVINGRYRLDAVIGRGGMATVYRGYDTRLARYVAVKISHPGSDAIATTLREEHASSALAHPNIVAIYDAGEVQDGEPQLSGTTYIVMELVEGKSGHDAAPVSWRQAVNIVRQVAEGLAAAHSRGIIHCDVKPSNILIDHHGRAVVTDFGVAAVVQSPVGDVVHGSPEFIAPERLAGAAPDPRVDIYGLGGTLAYLLTGRLPDDAGMRALPPDCPPSIRRVIDRSRALDPAARYADASAFSAALEEAIRNPDAVEIPSRDQEPTRRVPTAANVHRLRSAPAARPGSPHRAAATATPRSISRPRSAAGETRPRLGSAGTASLPLPRAGAVAAATIAIAIGLVALLAVIFIARSIDAPAAESSSVPTVVEMPDVRDRTFGEAIAMLTEQGIVVERVDVVYGPGPLNLVVAQTPAPGAQLNEGDPVRLVVRTGR